MRKIITITLNTAIDNLTEIGEFKVGITVKGKSALYQSGKGINVARAISEQGHKCIALGFVGKNELEFFKEMASDQVSIELTPVIGSTRMNISIVDSNHSLIIHTRASGYKLDDASIMDLIKYVKIIITEGDIIVLSGSVPNSEVDDAYLNIIDSLKWAGVKIILDSSSIELSKGIAAKPYAIKPNLNELQELTGKRLDGDVEIYNAAKQINETGIEFVFVSLGSDGVLLTQKGQLGFWRANVNLTDETLTGIEIGCGDAMVGGIALSIFSNLNIEDMLRKAVACGAANLFAKIPGASKSLDVERLFDKVTIKYFNS